MTESELLSKIDAINKQCESLSSQRAELLRQWVELVCPYKVGDVTKVLGYSHNGKMARIEAVHTKVKWQYKAKQEQYEWWVTARVLRKDGSDSSLTTDWEQRHREAK
jgi:hypothetical protein